MSGPDAHPRVDAVERRPTHVVICGISCRAVAESAANAGFAVTAIDGYADRDQHPAVHARSLPRDVGVPFSPAALVDAARAVTADAVVYLSNLDNRPSLVSRLMAGRRLWGNPPAVLHRVRDPLQVARALAAHGLPVPALHDAPGALAARPSPAFLTKPRASGGGHDIRRWQAGERLARDRYLQEFIEGVPGSVVFVAARGQAVPLGISRQLVGEAAFGATGFTYCGSILTPPDERLAARAHTLAAAVATSFNLVGLNGVDFIDRDHVPYPIEVNPRWSSSMELVERASGFSMFHAHARACLEGVLPATAPTMPAPPVAVGKAVVFARTACVAGDTRPWLDDPTVRDVPHPGDVIPAGGPICTVFAEGAIDPECHAALVARAAQIYDAVAAWPPRSPASSSSAR